MADDQTRNEDSELAEDLEVKDDAGEDVVGGRASNPDARSLL